MLIVWGGLNTLTATLLLADALDRPDTYDPTATLGHAAMWDPLFLFWGVTLALGLAWTRGAQRPSRWPTSAVAEPK